MMLRLALALLLGILPMRAGATEWSAVARQDVATLNDDDIARNAADPKFLDGLEIAQTRFSEAGFDWHLIRFINAEKPYGPLWAVPHDDENAAFDAAIAAVKLYGGVVVAVNSGPGSSRFQYGSGSCGGRPGVVTRCDPNRNFSAATPLYTSAYLGQLPEGQPVIALHTNSPGYGQGSGNITILDTAAAVKGITRPRKDGHFGQNQPAILNDPDSYAILPYRAPLIPQQDKLCRAALVGQGVHVWHERVGKSDGSLSNHIVLALPTIRYVNMESRRETDLSVAAERHRQMIEAYLKGCPPSGD